MTETINRQLEEYRAQLRQLEANANAMRGAIQALERLQKEEADSAEQNSDQK